MKAIRRSLKSDKDRQSHSAQHISVTPKSAIAIVPPKKVIKALYDYAPANQNRQELAFHKGDFFHVLSRENDTEWYEACNPLIPTARGLVPVAYFEVIGKTQRESGFSEDGTNSSSNHARSESTNTTRPMAQAPGHGRNMSTGRASGAMVYGVVQYDFNAERPDELEAKAGEAIIVIAQSTPEWFVAKPIGRLGGPGLIPVSFIEIKDMSTGQTVADPQEAVRRAGVPKVEEWKKMAAEYKNSSIALGRLDTAQSGVTKDMGRMSLQSGSQERVGTSNGYPNYSQPGQRSRQSQPQQPQQTSLVAPVTASLPRYCFDNDNYWYIIECQMEDGRHWELSRYYADFYDFQIALLENFPEEAGNKGKPRTLPFMPGPVAHVTDAISNGRRQNLDEYIGKILSMPPHISKCMLVRKLFAPRHGDFEIDPNAIGEDYRLSGTSQQSAPRDQSTQGSRQSSNSQQGYGVATAAVNRAAHSRAQPSMSAASGFAGPQAPHLHTQASTLTQGSTASSAKASGGAMKIKVHLAGEIVAIRVPQDISYEALKAKIRDRLGVDDDIMIRYLDGSTDTKVDLMSDEDLDAAIQRNPTKLALYVDYLDQ